MPRLRTLDVYPYSGWPTGPWDDDPAIDAAARYSAVVTAALALELREVALEAQSSELRLFAIAPEAADDGDLVVTVLTDPLREGFEAGHLRVPAAFADLRADVGVTSIAQAWRLALVELGRARGWDSALVDELFDRAVRADAGFRPVWRSEWKLAPGRRRRARVAARMEHDGFSRVWVEFGDREAPEPDQVTDAVVGDAALPPQLPGYEGLRWTGPTTVRFGRGGVLPVATDGKRRIRVTPLAGIPGMGVVPVAPGGTIATVPTVRYEPPPSFRVGGGYGSTSRRVAAYLETAAALDEQFRSPQWEDWWRGTGVAEVWAPIWFSGERAKVVVRKTGEKLSAIRYRPTETVPRSASASRELARADAEQLVRRVRERFGLDEPPPFAD